MKKNSKHRIILTGISGTLGHNVMELLGTRSDVSVCALARKTSKIPTHWGTLKAIHNNGFEKADIEKQIHDFSPTCVIHCAATGMEFPRTAWFDLIRFNVDVTINLCEAAAAVPNCHFIFIGTGLAYRCQGRALREDDPLDTLHPYGASKAAADMLVRSAAAEFGMPITVIRPFSFTGQGDSRTRLFASILRAAAEKRPMLLSSGTQIRDHCSARDIAAGIVAAMETGHAGVPARIINLGSGKKTILRDLIEEVVSELNLPVELLFGAREPNRFEPRHLVANIKYAKESLNWEPKHNFAHAVWLLAREFFPQLELTMPREKI